MRAHLSKINTERAHVHAVEESTKVLVEAAYAFVQELEVHHVGFEIGHAVAEFGEGWLEGVQREV